MAWQGFTLYAWLLPYSLTSVKTSAANQTRISTEDGWKREISRFSTFIRMVRIIIRGTILLERQSRTYRWFIAESTICGEQKWRVRSPVWWEPKEKFPASNWDSLESICLLFHFHDLNRSRLRHRTGHLDLLFHPKTRLKEFVHHFTSSRISYPLSGLRTRPYFIPCWGTRIYLLVTR